MMPIGTGNITEQGEEASQEPQDSVIPTPRFAREFATWKPTFALEELTLKIV